MYIRLPFAGVFLSALLLLSPSPSPAASISAGWAHSLWVKEDGSLWSWGVNYYGELGRPGGPDFRVGSANDWAQAAAGEMHSMAIKADGTLWAFGANHVGQLGFGNNAFATIPTQVGADTDWVKVVADDMHTMALKADGSLWAWGWNGGGQLGDGTTTQRLSPVRIGTDADWIDIAAGGGASFGLKAGGTLWSWGINQAFQLGRSLATPFNVPGLVDIPAPVSRVAAGNGQVYALRADGTLWSWGYGGGDLLGDGTTSNRPVPTQVGSDSNWVEVKGGGLFSAALKSDGTLWAWGGNTAQLGDSRRVFPTLVTQGSGWSSLSVGHSHAMVLAADGSLRSWGMNNQDALGVEAQDGSDQVISTPLLIEPGKPVPAIELTSSPARTQVGEAVILTARRPAGRYPIEGTVTFLMGATAIPGCEGVAMASSAANCTVSNLPAGMAALQALYNGSPTQNPSLSAGYSHFVGTYRVSVAKTGSGDGYLTDRNWIDCGATCSSPYGPGQTLEVTASASVGSVFGGWINCPSPNGTTCTIGALDQDRTITAIFGVTRRLEVTMPSLAGRVDISSPTVSQSCTTSCVLWVADGAPFTMTAFAGPEARFTGWSGDCAGTTCSITVDGDKIANASFDLRLRITKLYEGTGLVTSSPPGLDCGATCEAYYPAGTVVTIDAVPAPGSTFTGWASPGCVGTAPCTFTLSIPRTFEARFHIRSNPVDFDRDGRSDIVWRDANGQVALWTMAGTGASGTNLLLGPDTGWQVTHATGDFNGDGHADLLWRHTDGSIAAWLMDGANIIDFRVLAGPGILTATHLVDAEGDGTSGIILLRNDGSILYWRMSGLTIVSENVIFGPLSPGTPNPWRVTHVGDFDPAFVPGLVLRHEDGSVAIRPRAGPANPYFVVFGSGTSWRVTHVGNLGGSSSSDLVWRNDTTGDVAAWIMNGTSVTASAIIHAGGDGWTVSHLADLDGDGRTDLIWRHDDGSTAAWRMNGMQVLESALLLGPGPWSVIEARDYDGDGRADFLWRNVATGEIAIWLMNGLSVAWGGVVFDGSGGWVPAP